MVQPFTWDSNHLKITFLNYFPFLSKQNTWQKNSTYHIGTILLVLCVFCLVQPERKAVKGRDHIFFVHKHTSLHLAQCLENHHYCDDYLHHATNTYWGVNLLYVLCMYYLFHYYTEGYWYIFVEYKWTSFEEMEYNADKLSKWCTKGLIVLKVFAHGRKIGDLGETLDGKKVPGKKKRVVMVRFTHFTCLLHWFFFFKWPNYLFSSLCKHTYSIQTSKIVFLFWKHFTYA